MVWISLSICSAILFSVVLVLDRLLLATYMPSTKSFCFLVGLIQLVMALFVLILHPWSSNPSLGFFLVGISSGVIWALSILTIIYGVKKLEVSRVVPMASVYPVFVAIMAAPVLNERFSLIQYISILLTVAGVVLLAQNSLATSESSRKKANLYIYLIVLFGSVLSGVAHIAYKYALLEFDFWDLFLLRSLCCFSVWFICGLHSRLLYELKLLCSDKTALSVFISAEYFVPSISQ